MADTKISGLAAASLPLAGTEEVAVVQGGETRRAPATEITGLNSARRLRPPWARKISSDWRNNGGGSAICTAGSLRAQPFLWVDGLTITALEYYVQGSVTAGAELHVGIYDCDPASGMPSNLLWSSSVTLTTAGNKSFDVDPDIAGKRGVWVASYITTGSTQFATGGASGTAHQQMGLPTSTSTNTAINSLLSNASWPGAMPSIFSYATDGSGVTTGGTAPQFVLVLAAP